VVFVGVITEKMMKRCHSILAGLTLNYFKDVTTVQIFIVSYDRIIYLSLSVIIFSNIKYYKTIKGAAAVNYDLYFSR
jgi:hypothetical protein